MRHPKPIRLPHDAYSFPQNVFHIVFHALPGRKPFANPAVANATWTALLDHVTGPNVRIFAACLMPDHLHLVVSPREEDLISWVDRFKSYTTRLAWHNGIKGTIWQKRFYDRRLRDEIECIATSEYVLRNPAAAELVGDGIKWPWVAEWPEADKPPAPPA